MDNFYNTLTDLEKKVYLRGYNDCLERVKTLFQDKSITIKQAIPGIISTELFISEIPEPFTEQDIKKIWEDSTSLSNYLENLRVIYPNLTTRERLSYWNKFEGGGVK